MDQYQLFLCSFLHKILLYNLYCFVKIINYESNLPSAKGNSWEFVELFELDATQTTAQTVDSKSDDKKTFKVALKAAVTAVPKFYTNSTKKRKM